MSEFRILLAHAHRLYVCDAIISLHSFVYCSPCKSVFMFFFFSNTKLRIENVLKLTEFLRFNK